jgi:cysteine dioxygenase
VVELLGRYAKTAADWQPFALFHDACYARNLLAREERFELLLLCWGRGQESPIHNHEGQDCWMAVMDGEIEEVRYPRPDEVRAGPLAPRGSRSFQRGEVAYIHDDIGLHVIRSAQRDAAGVSMHLYAAPYDECNVYCPETGQVTRKKLVNYSVRGRRLEPAT